MLPFSKTEKHLDSELSCALRFAVDERLRTRLVQRPWGNKHWRYLAGNSMNLEFCYRKQQTMADGPRLRPWGFSFGCVAIIAPSCLKPRAGKPSSMLLTSISHWKINITVGLPHKGYVMVENQITFPPLYLINDSFRVQD